MGGWRIGSLFAGIGGLELGLERAGLGSVAWQVEIDERRRRVLAKHWPAADRHEDVRKVGRHNLGPVEVICGGFPCQDISSASRGRGGGIDGERSGLWRALVRVIGEVRPTVAVVENVAGAAGRWLPPLRRALHVLGYRTRALRVDAADIGAPHARARVFVAAYANQDGQPACPVDEEVARVPADAGLDRHWRQPFAGRLRVDDGVPRGLDGHRLAMLGDAVVPQAAELVGRVILADLRRAA